MCSSYLVHVDCCSVRFATDNNNNNWYYITVGPAETKYSYGLQTMTDAIESVEREPWRNNIGVVDTGTAYTGRSTVTCTHRVYCVLRTAKLVVTAAAVAAVVRVEWRSKSVDDNAP